MNFLGGGPEIEDLGGGLDLLYGGDGTDQVYGQTYRERAFGGAGQDYFLGYFGNDTFSGDEDNDTAYGEWDDDGLFGGSGADRPQGVAGADTLTRDEDADVFVFRDVTESPTDAANRDRFTDFQSGVDKIDATGATTSATVFIGGGAFSGTRAELCYVASSGLLTLNADGNGTADLMFQLNGAPTVVAGDLFL